MLACRFHIRSLFFFAGLTILFRADLASPITIVKIIDGTNHRNPVTHLSSDTPAYLITDNGHIVHQTRVAKPFSIYSAPLHRQLSSDTSIPEPESTHHKNGVNSPAEDEACFADTLKKMASKASNSLTPISPARAQFERDTDTNLKEEIQRERGQLISRITSKTDKCCQ